ncbi:hypothetical protein DL98DRAFT_556635 [Cadophora sp. DSE1049]|nr:hypothetical protein DL98DRAFT_556635 [Cadophora sp. DSE1049]
MPACRECRRRKLGCSKEHPSCKECRRLGAECVYEPKEKPGLKGGAVENLNRRVDASSMNLLQSVVNSYFSQFHPWIPMIHESTFRQKLSAQSYQADLEVILRAMIVAVVRFAHISEYVTEKKIFEITKACRDWVVLYAMNSLSVENLQALTMIAFDDIGNGNTSSAWSIVGSLTRTVEYLQLSVEIEEEKEHPLLLPCPLLSPPVNWTEIETRRRVFWNVFNLDRWNTSLTSDDVYRRLPADGALWRKQEHVLTPYFGIWDKSAGKIGNSIAYLPTHYPSPTQGSDHQSPASTRYGSADQTQEDLANSMSTIGAFAYRIEATESMSRVTTYFLQQKIDLQDQKQVGSWLTRFKELDLRLVHWKMFLPQKWKDTNISRRPAEIIMDPNLTLAHITHNASMMLLHQVIAYPSSQWEWASKLPSRWSADTCQAAAVETASITENYLISPTTSKIVNSQFVFCVFVAARVLLVHWRHYGDVNPMLEFTKLLRSLDTLSSRWQGGQETRSASRKDLAAKYAEELRSLQDRCTENPAFRIDVMGYAKELGTSEAEDQHISPSRDTALISVSTHSPRISSSVQRQKKRKLSQNHMESGHRNNRDVENGYSPGHTQEESSPQRLSASNLREDNSLPMLGQNDLQSSFPAILSPNHRVDAPAYPGTQLVDDGFVHPATNFQATENILGMDDINPISQMFVDQQFLDMDRVISYDDGLFSANMGWWGQDS